MLPYANCWSRWFNLQLPFKYTRCGDMEILGKSPKNVHLGSLYLHVITVVLWAAPSQLPNQLLWRINLLANEGGSRKVEKNHGTFLTKILRKMREHITVLNSVVTSIINQHGLRCAIWNYLADVVWLVGISGAIVVWMCIVNESHWWLSWIGYIRGCNQSY